VVFQKRGYKLLRSFVRFPGGAPAAGLLLLRVAIGFAAGMQGWAYLSGGGELTSRTALGALLILAGAALAIGLFTGAASATVGGAAICAGLSWLPAPSPNLFGAALPDVLIFVVAVALGLLGPGAWSVDARMFGFRQIVIGRP
jgi:uncharacterized membrane protein YphA (DoxX/SURF4 family)